MCWGICKSTDNFQFQKFRYNWMRSCLLIEFSAHLPHTTTLWTFSFGLHWSKIQLHILVAISFKMKVSFGIPLVYLNVNYFFAYFFVKSLCLHFLPMKIFEIFLFQTFHKWILLKMKFMPSSKDQHRYKSTWNNRSTSVLK